MDSIDNEFNKLKRINGALSKNVGKQNGKATNIFTDLRRQLRNSPARNRAAILAGFKRRLEARALPLPAEIVSAAVDVMVKEWGCE